MEKQPYDQEGSLLSKTRALIKDRKLSLPEIYKETGIPFYWLKKFVSGEIRNPSVNRVQYLYEKLTESDLV